MEKVQFNTYSDNQWTISPPSLRRFINDFKTTSKDKDVESQVLNFRAQWMLQRDNPIGKEKTVGYKTVALSKQDFMPVIEMLERDMNMKKPSFGRGVPPPSTNPAKLLLQLDSEIPGTDVMLQLSDESDENSTSIAPSTNASAVRVYNTDYEYKEVEDPVVAKRGFRAGGKGQPQFKNEKAQITVKDAFPKIVHLNG